MKKAALRAAVEARLTAIDSALATLDDSTAVDVTVLFEAWKPGVAYAVDQRLRYGDKLYRVVQAHTSQAGWEPPKTPALFVEIAKPGEIPVWKQPTGAHDAYRIGDKVHYPGANDPVYENDVDYNAYAPDVYGWHLV